MLNVVGQDLSRRGLVKVGSLGLMGVTLPKLLRAESKMGSSGKSIIHIHLDGGPPQMDMIDPKPEAPSQSRGPFASIPSAIPGYHLSELMPNCARIADRLIFLRSLVGSAGRHNAFQCQSGFNEKDLASIGGRPAMGCVVNRLYGTPSDPAPTFVDLMQGRGQVRNSCRPGFLGPVYQPFRPDITHLFQRELEAGMVSELKRLGHQAQAVPLTLNPELTLGRLDDRMGLLRNLDTIRKELDAKGAMESLDQFHHQAASILTSGRLANALDLEREDPVVVERYTPPFRGSGNRFYTAEGPNAAKKFLLARRLVEAGARVVSLSLSDFDTHKSNHERMRDLVPIFDHALHALVLDLEERGMLDDVTILAWGEFGRTPKINSNGGRDHWPKVAMGMMAGGGMKGGQFLGVTDRYASEALERPIHYQDVIATLYHNLGIDPRKVQITDSTGRPQYLVDVGQVIRELV